MTNILGSGNSQNKFLVISSRILFPLAPGLQLRIYLSSMGWIIKIRLLLVVVFIFPLSSLMLHRTALLLTALFPVFFRRPLLRLPVLFVHSMLLQNPKLRGEGGYNRTLRGYHGELLQNRNMCYKRTL